MVHSVVWGAAGSHQQRVLSSALSTHKIVGWPALLVLPQLFLFQALSVCLEVEATESLPHRKCSSPWSDCP